MMEQRIRKAMARTNTDDWNTAYLAGREEGLSMSNLPVLDDWWWTGWRFGFLVGVFVGFWAGVIPYLIWR